MHRWVRSCVVAVAALAACAGSGAVIPGAAQAARAPQAAARTQWVKISSNTGLGIASAGLLRTSDGKLHVVWARHDGSTFSLHYSTVGRARLLASTTIVSHWANVSFYPRLIPVPGGRIRLVFTGGNGQNGSPFNSGAMYTATSSAAGKSWALFNGSMSASKLVPLTDTAAAAQSDGTPVAAWSAGTQVSYHVGISTGLLGQPDPAVAEGQGEGEGAWVRRGHLGE